MNTHNRPRKLKGVVFRLFGKLASVRAVEDSHEHHSEHVDCYIRGRLFDAADDLWKNHLAVGDEVDYELLPNEVGKGVISYIYPRRTQLVRRLSEKKRRLQRLASNVDQLIVVGTVHKPPLRPGLIDRYLAIAHHASIRPAICVNKLDLATEEELAETTKTLDVYQELRYPILYTSAVTGLGIDKLRQVLKGNRSVLVGHSGVGKSKLAAAIQPSVRLLSSELDRHGRGRHTTTTSLLITLDSGGELVDTPGIRELGMQHIPLDELAHCYPTMRPFINECRFNKCSHVHEPDCAVKIAVSRNQVPQSRYDSYVKLYEEIAVS